MSMNDNNTWHITPVNDLKPHLETNYFHDDQFMLDGEVRQTVLCDCECGPEIKYTENNGVLIVHNSFDGREGVEWANEILGNK